MKLKLILWLVILFFYVGQSYGASFTDNGDDTISDSSTDLMWVKTETTTMIWELALSHCEGLTHATYADWRLPNQNELQSLIDYSKTSAPTTDTTFFPNALSSMYWTSSTKPNSVNGAMIVNLLYGNLQGPPKSESHYVRCVR